VKVTDISLGALNLTPHSQRSPGCHISDVIRDLENTVTKPGERRKYDQLSLAEKTRMGNYTSVGWAWESIIKRGLLDAGFCPIDCAVTPGELVLDGLAGTPDWLILDPYKVVEFKATWRSSARSLDADFWAWLVQIRAYCKMLQARQAELYVLYVNGDYRDSGPQYKGYELAFSELELEENWAMLTNHARERKWIK
jgi:hypothetical protein